MVRRRWTAFLAVALMAWVAACGHGVPSALRMQHQAWDNLRLFDYQYDLLASGFCGVTTTHIQVRGGQLVSATVEHPGCDVIPPLGIDGVFDFVAGDYRHGYGMKVTYDPTLHYPMQVSVDPIKNAIDDEYGLEIRNFRRL
jgi:hypothetical protein